MVLSLGINFTTVFQPWSIQSWSLLKDNDFFLKSQKFWKPLS